MPNSLFCPVFAAPLLEATCTSRGWVRRRLFAFSLLLVVLVSAPEAGQFSNAEERPAWRVKPESCFLVDNFDEGIQNRLGGYRNAFFRKPSFAEARRERGDAPTSAPTGRGRVLRLSGRRGDSGFCGTWVHLYDMRSREASFFDASSWDFLTFWIRGDTGGESVRVKIADARWHAKEDSMPVGLCDEFLSDGITTSWQQVVIPREKLTRLNLKQLASISFEFLGQSPASRKQTVFIDDICFKQSPRFLAAAPARVEDEFRKNSPPGLKPKPRAMWIWSTAELIRNATECRRLFEACHQENIGLLWIQLPYELVDALKADSIAGSAKLRRARISRAAELRSFLKEAHRRGLQVHALDGYPEFALRENHAVPLAVVDEIVRFNSKGQKEERFDGVHLDNEPYLILAWQDPARRERILHDFLLLNVECQRRARAARLEYGIDIPFWWNAFNADGEASGTVTFRGERKPASFHCIDLLDNVGIMNYRDAAGGADGMIAHGRELLRYADSVDKADIFMGVETFQYDPQPVWFVLGLTGERFRATLNDRGHDFSVLSRHNGFRFFRFDDGRRTNIGIEIPTNHQISLSAKRLATLTEIAKRFGEFTGADVGHDEAFEAAQKAMQANPEWTEFKRRDLPAENLGATFPGFVATRLMLGKVTFADDPPMQMQREMEFAEESFQRFHSFRGLAIHSWEAWRTKRGNAVRSAARRTE